METAQISKSPLILGIYRARVCVYVKTEWEGGIDSVLIFTDPVFFVVVNIKWFWEVNLAYFNGK